MGYLNTYESAVSLGFNFYTTGMKDPDTLV
jgi:hypothetical protein